MSTFPRISPVSGIKAPLYGTGWDLATVGGEKVAGHSYITKGGIRLKEDEKKKAGVHGGDPTYHGLQPQEFELVVNVWTDEQLALLQKQAAKWLPSSNATPEAKPVDHPAIRALPGVAAFVIFGGTILGPSKDIKGGKSMSFHLRHKLPQKKPATQTVKKTPRYETPNKRREDAQKRNPPPSAQTATTAPPTKKAV